jgi:hypothetical protein
MQLPAKLGQADVTRSTRYDSFSSSRGKNYSEVASGLSTARAGDARMQDILNGKKREGNGSRPRKNVGRGRNGGNVAPHVPKVPLGTSMPFAREL